MLLDPKYLQFSCQKPNICSFGFVYLLPPYCNCIDDKSYNLSFCDFVLPLSNESILHRWLLSDNYDIDGIAQLPPDGGDLIKFQWQIVIIILKSWIESMEVLTKLIIYAMDGHNTLKSCHEDC